MGAVKGFTPAAVVPFLPQAVLLRCNNSPHVVEKTAGDNRRRTVSALDYQRTTPF